MSPPKRRAPSRASKPRDGVVWLGGRFPLPTYVMEDTPFRPDLVLWMELPTGLVLDCQVVHPDEASPLTAALRVALDRASGGAARKPDTLRVARAEDEAELRRAFGASLHIDVAATPELEAVFQDFLARGPATDADEEPGYLDRGRIPEGTVARMFEAAAMLYRVAPWRAASDSDILRMDIPQLGVEGACVSIIGALGQSHGVIIFPSLLGYERFGAAAAGPPEGPLDLGGQVLSLDFSHTRDLAPKTRQEIAQHGWTTVAPDAMPIVTHRDRDGVPRPLDERDVKIATECARAVASFSIRHREAFTSDGPPRCESFTTHDTGITVKVTFPYDAANLFDDGPRPAGAPPAPAIARARAGRNDPCPCGSGKKYKKCCLDEDAGAQAADRKHAAVRDLDQGMVRALGAFARDRFGAAWEDACDRFLRLAEGGDPTRVQLAAPWSVYEMRVHGRRVVDAFVAEHGGRLTRDARDWLASQQNAGVGLWEVTSAEPGVAVVLRNLLSGEVRRVVENQGSRTLVLRDAILARVVDHAGSSYLCGAHSHLLPPDIAADVVKSVKRGARARKVPVETPDEDLALAMVRAWAKATRKAGEDAAHPKELRLQLGLVEA